MDAGAAYRGDFRLAQPDSDSGSESIVAFDTAPDESE